MTNPAIAALFNEIADFLEIKGDNPFRVRAYRRAAETAEGLAEDLAAVAARGGLLEIPGIGKDLAAKIQEYLDHGTVEYLEGLRREIPPGVVELMRIHGVGPKTAKLLYERAGVDSVEKLEALAQAHKLVGIPGIQAKTEENILKGIAVWKSGQERMPLGAALPLAEAIVASLRSHGAVERIALAGSLRRMKETVKDIDVLVTSKTPARVMEVFLGLPNVADVLVHGDTKSSVRLREKIQVDLRVVEPACFGAALQYFTGSKQHNIRVRELAQRRGLKVNEYGVFEETGDRRVAGATEEEVYRAVGLACIPPEIREDGGEIEAALDGRLPTLVTLDEIRGDLQLHTTWSDGVHSLEELAAGVRARGYQYMAVTDHSKSATVAGGMDEARVVRMIAEVRALNRRLKGFRVLAGCEVDIRADGSSGFPGRDPGPVRPRAGVHPLPLQDEPRGDDGAHRPRRPASLGPYPRSSDGSADRRARRVRGRHGHGSPGGQGGRRRRGDQRVAVAPGPERRPCAASQGSRHPHHHQHRRPRHRATGLHAVRRGGCAAGVAHGRGHPQHAPGAGTTLLAAGQGRSAGRRGRRPAVPAVAGAGVDAAWAPR